MGDIQTGFKYFSPCLWVRFSMRGAPWEKQLCHMRTTKAQVSLRMRRLSWAFAVSVLNSYKVKYSVKQNEVWSALVHMHYKSRPFSHVVILLVSTFHAVMRTVMAEWRCNISRACLHNIMMHNFLKHKN